MIRLVLIVLIAVSKAMDISAPKSGERLLAAWLDTTNLPNGATGDRPASLNARMGFNFGAFQYGQNLPITDYPFPEEQVYATNTNALVYLTVYNLNDPWSVTEDQIKNLTMQCGKLNANGRPVLLRFWPEMNGNWFTYGQQPSEFIAVWKKVYNKLRVDAPLTKMVWAPSSGNGYPYNYPITIGSQNSVKENQASVVTSQNFQLLDTNGDGIVNAEDDSFSPYYPGDEFVDWIGMSVYHYAGHKYPWDFNWIPYSGKFVDVMNINGFYDQYATQKNKPFMIAESGAAYHTNTLTNPEDPHAPVPTELEVKQPWWRQYVTNSTFLDLYPKIHLICLFEFYKPEELQRDKVTPDWRDFRITVNDTIRNAFLKDFQAVSSLYSQAVAITPTKSNSTAASSTTAATPSSVDATQASSASTNRYVFLFLPFLLLVI